MTTLRLIRFALLASVAGLAGPAPAPAQDASDRLDALSRASIFTPRAVSRADIVKGPDYGAGQLPLPFNARVTCEFEAAGEEGGGNTPKFACRQLRGVSASGKPRGTARGNDAGSVKVKFRPDNREIYAEVAATRLFWALGFYADAMHPVRLQCTNCPEDPMKGEGPRATRSFPEAVIERKFPGRSFEEAGEGDQGWSWKELDLVQQPVHVRDGLKLLAAFVVHGDNKPEQQRLSCEAIRKDPTDPGRATCVTPRLLVQDLGATFGGGGRLTRGETAKMNLEEWSGKQVWKRVGTGEPGTVACEAQLPKSLTAKDGLDDPEISEEGRRFLAGLLCQLSDKQIDDLFRVARVAEMPDHRNPDGTFKPGFDEADVIRQWAQAFKRKRQEVAGGRCTWQSRPANLASIDNPARLRAVPNYCTAGKGSLVPGA